MIVRFSPGPRISGFLGHSALAWLWYPVCFAAATVVAAELAPVTRRGEAMGWFGVANSLGMIVGPAAGTGVAAHLGYPALFVLAAGTWAFSRPRSA